MKCRSKQILLSGHRVQWGNKKNHYTVQHALYARSGFSLVEAVTALIILALISSSILVVIDRCITSVTDSSLRMQAFEVARENMELLLSESSVAENVEYGSSDKYPEIKWQTVVETFYEPLTDRVWVRGVCSSEYTDSAGDIQTVELTQWLTGLTKKQILQMLEQRQKEWEDEEIIKTIEDAADYAGVDVDTIQQWVENGMPLTEGGFYIKVWLDLYEKADGEPTDEEREFLAEKYMRSKDKTEKQDELESETSESETDEPESDESGPEPKIDSDESPVQPDYPPSDEYGPEYIGSPSCGFVPRSELPKMSLQELYELIRCLEQQYR